MTGFKNTKLLSTKELGLAEINTILDTADKFYPVAIKEQSSNILEGKILAALFYEPSTRTRLSFETAMLRLGGKVISVSGIEGSSLSKGETLADTARVVDKYADIVAIRHPEIGSVAEYAIYSAVPVINGGDGPGEHPTQALLDLYTIKKERGKIDGITVAFVGDLKFGRTVKSLSYLLANYAVKFIFVSPKELTVSEEVKIFLRAKNVEFTETTDILEGLKNADVLYMTRIQKERFSSLDEYEKLKGVYVLDKEQLEKYAPNITVMHPLPRVGEISLDVDDFKGAAYFREVQNGVALRMALLALLLGF